MNWSAYLLFLSCFTCLYASFKSTRQKTSLTIQFHLFLIVSAITLAALIFFTNLPDRVIVYMAVLLTLLPISTLFSLSRVLKPPYLQHPSWYSFLPLAFTPFIAEFLQPNALLSVGLMVLQTASLVIFTLFFMAYYKHFQSKIALTLSWLFSTLFIVAFWYLDLLFGGGLNIIASGSSTLLSSSALIPSSSTFSNLSPELYAAIFHLSATGGVISFTFVMPQMEAFIHTKS